MITDSNVKYLIYTEKIIFKTLQLQMMNQTEILKIRGGPENSCVQNIQSSSFSNQMSGVTIIKAHTYQSVREKTPKAQILPRTNSSHKLIRVGSTKGINVVSLRPSSTQKQVREFNSANYISHNGSSQTTIKMEESPIIQQMREQLKKTIQRYEDKMNQELSYQHNYLTVQIQRLKQLLIQNEGKLAKEQFEIQQLLKRVETVERKIETKTNLMSKQLDQFRKFYEQCFAYTIKRVNEAESSMKTFSKLIQQTTSTTQKVQSWRYVQYANNLVRNIIVNTSAQTSSLKYFLDEEIYELQLGVGKFQQQYEQLDKIVYEMKNTKFGNESLRQCVKQLGKFGVNVNILRKDNYKQNLLQYYEPKFNEIIKRVNNSTIQVDLVKGLVESETQMFSKNIILQEQKILELSKIIETLEHKISQDKSWYTSQLAERQQIVSKSHPRILQLQTKLHSFFEQETQMLKQISDLKLKVAYYQTKCEKNSERQYGIQSSLAQAFSQTLVKEKIKLFVQQKKILSDKIAQLNDQIKKLDNQNFLLAQKLMESQQLRQSNIKLEAQLKFVSKMLEKNQQISKIKFEQEKKQHKELQEQIKKYQAEIGQMQKQIEDQRKKSQQFQNKISVIIKERTNVTEDDDQYFEQLEEEVQKNYKQIQKLQKLNKELATKNKQLMQKNQQLEDDLHNYAETFEKQSITFRSALQNLQRQKDFMTLQFKKIGQENKILKMDLEQTRTAQSFYENNNSALSVQLRKTVSSDLNEGKISESPAKKLQKRVSTSQVCKLKPRSSHSSFKASKLKNILEKLNYDLPVICQIDSTGYLKDQRTGCYFVDEGDNYFYLDQDQLAYAVKIGLIVL